MKTLPISDVYRRKQLKADGFSLVFQFKRYSPADQWTQIFPCLQRNVMGNIVKIT